MILQYKIEKKEEMPDPFLLMSGQLDQPKADDNPLGEAGAKAQEALSS